MDFCIKEGSTSLPQIGGAKHVFNNLRPSMNICITLSSQVNLFQYKFEIKEMIYINISKAKDSL